MKTDSSNKINPNNPFSVLFVNNAMDDVNTKTKNVDEGENIRLSTLYSEQGSLKPESKHDITEQTECNAVQNSAPFVCLVNK